MQMQKACNVQVLHLQDGGISYRGKEAARRRVTMMLKGAGLDSEARGGSEGVSEMSKNRQQERNQGVVNNVEQ